MPPPAPAPAPTPPPSRLTRCDDAIPELGVTRQFDFGQFIELFQEPPQNPPTGSKPTPVRIVLDTRGELAEQSQAQQQTRSPLMAQAPATASNDTQEQQASLTKLLSAPVNAALPVLEYSVARLNDLEDKNVLTLKGKSYALKAPAAALEALRQGLVVDAPAASGSDPKQPAKVMLRLMPEYTELSLSEGQVASLLAEHTLKVGQAVYQPHLDAGAIRALREGQAVLTRALQKNGKTVPLKLTPSRGAQPLSASFDIYDVDTFLTQPQILARNGETLAISLQPKQVNELLNQQPTAVQMGAEKVLLTPLLPHQQKDPRPKFREKFIHPEADDSTQVLLTIKPPGMSWTDYLNKIKHSQGYFVRPPKIVVDIEPPEPPAQSGGGQNNPTPPPPGMADQVAPRLPKRDGLPVAVFVPWRQEWTLKGFSRGHLLQSIALAPQEELTLQVFSWERRARSLEQSSETDTEQSTDINQSSRDTEDVFKEMVSKRDFAWQVSGSIDASYSNGVASVNVQVGGGVSDTTSIQQTVRNSSQSVKEATIKASSRVRTKRVTRITQTVEQGREERTTRVIRNPNQCHTLTMDFFETLAHYTINLSFQADRLRLVVLIPNPLQIDDFHSEVVRRNESSLRNALLEPALAEGFDACRMVAAYQEAKRLLAEQQAESVKLEELPTQRSDPPPGGANMPSPAEQQAAELGRVVNAMIKALQTIRSKANIDNAMAAIGSKPPNKVAVTEEDRRNGQYWLFINLCAAKFPALLTALDEMASGGGGANNAEKAQRLLSVLPKPDAATNLGNLAQISDREKEEGGLASKILSQPGYIFWDWGFWTENLKNESLYTPNDAGLAGLAEQLARAYQEWLAKQAQGEAMKNADVAKTEAEGRQEKASTDDKLAMAFPLDELARAWERQKILCAHFNDHKDHYNYALFQSLPVTEQATRIVAASDGKLNVGMFEPRVVAMSGRYLAVPLTPLATSHLATFVNNLRTSLTTAFNSAALNDDTVVLPTPGVSVSTRLGECSGCEEYIEQARMHELTRLDALARQQKAEAERREALIAAKRFEPFDMASPDE